MKRTVFIYGSFCRYICPLGAFLAAYDKIAFHVAVHYVRIGNRLKPILIKTKGFIKKKRFMQ